MKKILILITILVLSSITLNAKTFAKTASVKPVLIQKGNEKHWCPVCGMSIKMFYKTSHASKLQNGIDRQYCSIRCLVVDMQEYGIDTKNIKVVDASTQKLIDATKAHYVLGSKVKGTMSRVSKLAFAHRTDAEKFVEKYKGKVVNFDTVLTSAKESLKSDAAMLKKKKEKKIYPNVDFYAAIVLNALGIPKEFFPLFFASSRITGWTAHMLEQYSDSVLIRPTSRYTGVYGSKFVPIKKRS